MNNDDDNNSVAKNVAVTAIYGNSGPVSQPIPANTQPHLLSQSQPGSHFPGHFQLSEPQVQTFGQARTSQAHPPTPSAPAQSQVQSQIPAQVRPFGQFHNNANSNSNNATGTLPPSAPITTSGGGSAKRASQKPSSRPSGSSNANTASHFKTMELTPTAPRKKPRLSEKLISDKVAAVLPESALYTRLLEFEDRIDASLYRKKIDIQESLRNPPRVQSTLRIYIYNTFANQGKTDSVNKNGEEPSWSLRITGRILEDGKDPVLAGNSPSQNVSYPKLSVFFKKLTIYLDQTLYPYDNVIVWDSTRSSVAQDGFEVMRKGDKEFTAVIRIEMNYMPEKYKLSAQLAEVLGIEVETRPRIVSALWHYIKTRKLQSPGDPSFFMCNPPLQKVFGEEKMKFSLASQKITQHLSQPLPIHVEHRVKLSGNFPIGTACYDALVDVPLPLEKYMASFVANTERNREIDACDERICASIKRIYEHRRRRAFFLGFSQSPAEFINALIVSQSKDLKLVAGDASHIVEKEQHRDFYVQPWVDDAVIRYLNRKSAASDAPGSTYQL